MKTNFLDTECSEPSRTDSIFGVCDDNDNSKAYTSIEASDNWIANVINSTQKPIIFTPIDNCLEIFKEGTNQKESTCDGMLTFEETLYLLELKSQRGQWISKAIEQLKNTIKLIKSNHNLDEFKYKKAFACNKKHPRFVTIDNELNSRLFKEFGFRIDIQATIKIN